MNPIQIILLGKIALIFITLFMVINLIQIIAEGSLILAAAGIGALYIVRELWLFLRHHEKRINAQS